VSEQTSVPDLNSSAAPVGTQREVVGLFADRTAFEKALQTLLAAGFTRSDLSVLSSHESLDVAAASGRDWRTVLTGLVGEVKYEGPLVAAGLIALAAGPVGAAIAGLLAAGIGTIAAGEFWAEITARPHSEHFARALDAGSIILWVLAPDDATEAKAKELLTQAGGANIHSHLRAG